MFAGLLVAAKVQPVLVTEYDGQLLNPVLRCYHQHPLDICLRPCHVWQLQRMYNQH